MKKGDLRMQLAIKRNTAAVGTALALACAAACAGAVMAPADAHAASVKGANVNVTADGAEHAINASVSGAYSSEVYYSTQKLTASNYKSAGSTTPIKRVKAGSTKVYVAYVYKNKKSSSKVFKSKSFTINVKPSVGTEGTTFAGATDKTYSGVYDQAAHGMTVVAGASVAGDYDVYYSTGKALNYRNFKTTGSTTAPTFTKAGNNKVYWIAVPKGYNAYEKDGAVDKTATAKNVKTGSKVISIKPKAMTSADIKAHTDLATAMTGYGFTGKATDDGTAANTKYYYNGKTFSDVATGANKLTLTATDKSASLVKGKDFTVKWKNNLKVGTATVTLAGKGNYTGSKTIQFSINNKAISECYFMIGGKKVGTGASISASSLADAYEWLYYGSHKTVKPTIKVYTDSSYTNLVSRSYYKVTYNEGKTAAGDYANEGMGRVIGTASVKIDGGANMTGSTTITFNVVSSKA